ncbi:hypothetical protein O9G_002051 [Rozella allomycis CSF55]|uniref:Uncharacterized protein n=1 Tax=Rozella allomycis (strain CSF55) TaxID=988480 RepID=A0A075AVY6_ROZAC|nr:hypothetical protein O9G_002051 [Rozella allomycis CSF55]|eukprot:EPZ34478.1 hypothetical protein O9G_002051 [Rozella allomycis CSF55]
MKFPMFNKVLGPELLNCEKEVLKTATLQHFYYRNGSTMAEFPVDVNCQEMFKESLENRMKNILSRVEIEIIETWSMGIKEFIKDVNYFSQMF